MARRSSILLALALVSAGALAAFLVVGVWSAMDSMVAGIRVEVERSVARCARAVQQALSQPSLQEQLPPESGFALGDDALVVPAAVGWFEGEPPGQLEREIPWPALALVRQAERVEFGRDDRAAAQKLLADALQAPELDRASRAYVTLAAAWTAARAGDGAARDRALASLAADELPLCCVVSAALLRGAADPRVALLEPVPAHAVAARLAERGTDVAALERAIDAAAAQRALLRSVQPRLPLLAASANPVCHVAGGDVLLYFPATRRGAVVAVAQLLDALRRDPRIPWVGEAVHGDRLPENAAMVVPGLAIVPPAEAAAAAAGPQPFVVLLGLLLLVFAGSSVFAWRAVRRESQAAAVRAEFLTSVTHELKTPLASIRLFADLLAEGRAQTEAKRQEYCGVLASETARLSTLLENVLDLGRLQRGERAYDVQEFDVAAHLAHVAEVFGPIARDSGLEVRLEAERRTVRADPAALTQALLNLLENARKYAGGPVDVVGRAVAGGYAITVRDRGPGVPPDERERIFARFERGAAQRDGATPGLGLGLYLARELARALGGDLVYVPPPEGGAGACFTLTLPIAEAR